MYCLLPKSIVIADVIENSFKDYHVKGFDYICLKRSPEETIKIYFFDGDVANMSEVVNPHDHRYDFTTHVLAGSSQNITFEEDPNGTVYQGFDFRTPLNGGNGFAFKKESRLSETNRVSYAAGQRYHFRAEQLHTIRVASSQTILCLQQFEDRRAIGDATSTFTQDREPPSLTGLYSRFKADEIKDRLDILERLTGVRVVAF